MDEKVNSYMETFNSIYSQIENSEDNEAVFFGEFNSESEFNNALKIINPKYVFYTSILNGNVVFSSNFNETKDIIETWLDNNSIWHDDILVQQFHGLILAKRQALITMEEINKAIKIGREKFLNSNYVNGMNPLTLQQVKESMMVAIDDYKYLVENNEDISSNGWLILISNLANYWGLFRNLEDNIGTVCERTRYKFIESANTKYEINLFLNHLEIFTDKFNERVRRQQEFLKQHGIK